ncbi:MAG: hypothetical protein JO220_05965 [Hyphomicrobiales bacterium]|nr:hypothetical protein [Hyphomicrobiales bacterium]
MTATERIDSGIPMPLVASVRPVDHENRLVEVTWADGNRRGRKDVVDLSPLIDTHQFYRPLRNDPALFDTIHLVDNGEAVGWGDDSIDMSADSIERLAAEAMRPEDFRAFLARNNLTQEQAATILGRSRRRIASYANEGGIPRIVALACRGYEAGVVARQAFSQISFGATAGFASPSAEWDAEQHVSVKYSRPRR